MTDQQTVIAGQKNLAAGAKDMFRALVAFDQTVLGTDTALPKKYKELMAVAVALTTQCPGCLSQHTAAAIAAGASQAELAETVHVAAALRAGAAMYHGMAYVMPHAAGDHS
ncbi:AhpD family alkylhydroperoxidase [Microbacterium sp. AG790]|uniref:carboxymuconolactone decarboxylase family protein n=1 Tax=Microbacterium sp. AG790 TaxID=2183995 RepID=UPI000F145D4D|nr:carboxymuconolactone decarboxylase family protein [Microbacterium sp. AG790]RKS94371.1 AhpD family alkylhydroperoxidase [Microbacterium sp. AG790]